MFSIARSIPQASLLSRHSVIIKRHASVNIFGYDLYKQWFTKSNTDASDNIFSRNTLIAKTWRNLPLEEKNKWMQKAEAMEKLLKEQKRQTYESRQYSMYSRLFCFYRIRNIITHLQKSNGNVDNKKFGYKIKILELLEKSGENGVNKVEKIKKYVNTLNTLNDAEFQEANTSELEEIKAIMPDFEYQEIATLWEELLADVQVVVHANFLRFTANHENNKHLLLFNKIFDKFIHKFSDVSEVVSNFDTIKPYLNYNLSRFELYLLDQLSTIDDPFDFMVNFGTLIKKHYRAFKNLSKEESEALDEKSLQLDRHPDVAGNIPIIKKSSAYQLFVKESFYKTYFDHMLLDKTSLSIEDSENGESTFKNYDIDDDYDNIEEMDADEVDEVDETDNSQTRGAAMHLQAFVDLNKEWHSIIDNAPGTSYWKKLIKKFDEDNERFSLKDDADHKRVMSAARAFDNSRKFMNFTAKLYFVELNYPHFSKYVALNSRRGRRTPIKKKDDAYSDLNTSYDNLLITGETIKRDFSSGEIFYNFYDLRFQRFNDHFDLIKTFEKWNHLQDEERVRYFILSTILRVLSGKKMDIHFPKVFGKTLTANDFLYVYKKHMDASYLKKAYPQNKMYNLAENPDLWVEVCRRRHVSLRKFLSSSLDIYKHLKNIDAAETFRFKKIVGRARSPQKTMENIFKSVPRTPNILMTYEDFFMAKRDVILKDLGYETIGEYLNTIEDKTEKFEKSLAILNGQSDNYEEYLHNFFIENAIDGEIVEQLRNDYKEFMLKTPSSIHSALHRFATVKKQQLIGDFVEESVLDNKAVKREDISNDKNHSGISFENSKNQSLYTYLSDACWIYSFQKAGGYWVPTDQTQNPSKFLIVKKMGAPLFFKNVLSKFPQESIGLTNQRVQHNAYMHAYRDGTFKFYSNPKNIDFPIDLRLDCTFLMKFKDLMHAEQLRIYHEIKKENPTAVLKFSDVIVPQKTVKRFLNLVDLTYPPCFEKHLHKRKVVVQPPES